MKIIGIYPGSFQPAHRGHANAYRKLKQLVGDDTFVVTTDKTPTPEAPLNFGEKEQLLVRHGIPISHIAKVNDWKHPVEIFHKFTATQTSVIFALNRKEYLDIVHRKVASPSENGKIQGEQWMDEGGRPSYFQPYKTHETNMKSLDIHGYVIVIDDSEVDGKPITTANIRDVLGSEKKYPIEKRKKFFVWVFGWFDIGLFQMVSEKFKQAFSTSSNMEVPKQIQSTQLKEIVKTIFKELTPSPSATPSAADTNIDPISGTSTYDTQQKTPYQQKTDLVKQKKELEAKAKQDKQQHDQYATVVKNYDTFQKKNDRDAIDAINKQISTAGN